MIGSPKSILIILLYFQRLSRVLNTKLDQIIHRVLIPVINSKFKIGNNNKAFANYSKAFQLGVEEKSPEVAADLYFNRGTIFLERGERENAIADFKLAVDHGSQDAMNNLIKLGIQYTAQPLEAKEDD
jgi:tetratricopeptide (TPR) repeat protein